MRRKFNFNKLAPMGKESYRSRIDREINEHHVRFWMDMHDETSLEARWREKYDLFNDHQPLKTDPTMEQFCHDPTHQDASDFRRRRLR